jgi:RND family efflux transporter MFP subunit
MVLSTPHNPMNTINITRSPNFLNRLICLIVGFSIAMLLLTSVAQGQIDGFTEPFRKIELSSDESGSISELSIEEGDAVSKGDVIARLDGRVQELQLEIADHLAGTKSELVAASETLKKREAIASRLQQLKDRGHASESEIIRAEMELSIANAKYLAAKEEQVVREIEKRRAEVQLQRRTITSPIDGVIATIHRREGEFLSPLHPEIVTVIQVNRLLATFPVPSPQVKNLKVGQEFELELENGDKVDAAIHRIGVETDAESGTVQVKLVIENDDMKVRSGEMCLLDIEEDPAQ